MSTCRLALRNIWFSPWISFSLILSKNTSSSGKWTFGRDLPGFCLAYKLARLLIFGLYFTSYPATTVIVHSKLFKLFFKIIPFTTFQSNVVCFGWTQQWIYSRVVWSKDSSAVRSVIKRCYNHMRESRQNVALMMQERWWCQVTDAKADLSLYLSTGFTSLQSEKTTKTLLSFIRATRNCVM